MPYLPVRLTCFESLLASWKQTFQVLKTWKVFATRRNALFKARLDFVLTEKSQYMLDAQLFNLQRKVERYREVKHNTLHYREQKSDSLLRYPLFITISQLKFSPAKIFSNTTHYDCIPPNNPS